MALAEIIEHKQREVETMPRAVSPPHPRARRSLEAALRAAEGPAFIFECKAASPSRGRLASGEYDPVAQASAYMPFANAISVLADERFFGGGPDHVRRVRDSVTVPVLYKDVIVDEAQVLLARACGADAVLLMASVLDDAQLTALGALAEEVDLEVLAEAHDANELERIVALGFPIIGINNRDLTSLEVDLGTLRRLAHLVPADRLLISESGIRCRGDVIDGARHCDGFLIGGVLNASDRPDLLVRELVFGRTKVCGLTSETDAQAAYASGATDGGVVLAASSSSPRAVDLATAERVLAGSPLRRTGVFVNDNLDHVVTAARQLQLDAVQLHGDEDVDYIQQLRARLGREVDVVGVQRLDTADDVQLERLDGCDRLLLDKFVDGVPGGTGRTVDLAQLDSVPQDTFRSRIAVAGGLGPDNLSHIAQRGPVMAELNSAVESEPGRKDPRLLNAAFSQARALATRRSADTSPARFGAYGGSFVPQILVPALRELTAAFERSKADEEFRQELRKLLEEYAGRPTPLYQTTRLVGDHPARIVLKREDLVHGGAHKTNQVLAQALLAQRLGKTRLIAETGAGQHGVATAMVAARFGLECVIYMGATDVARQRPNVERMEMLGAEVRAVRSGAGTLKEAINEAMRDWAHSYEATHYVLGTVAGPHPYPTMVRDFQRVIGDEARAQCIASLGRLPDVAVACVGGGSNAIGLFTAFLDDDVELVGVEPHGHGLDSQHGATLSRGRPGVLHGARTYLLQSEQGQIEESYSISAGLDYPGVGPEHAALKDSGRVVYDGVTDHEALDAFEALMRCEGIIGALESAHAVAYALRRAALGRDELILVNLSGRGDKDLATVRAARGGAP